MYQEVGDLLPEGLVRIKGIQGEHADEQDGQDTYDPWGPVQEFGCGFHDCML